MGTDGQMSIFDYPEALPDEKHSIWKVRYDTDTLMIECDACGCRVHAVQYAKAVGICGYRFCPYCGARIMNAPEWESEMLRMKWPMTMAEKFERIERALP